MTFLIIAPYKYSYLLTYLLTYHSRHPSLLHSFTPGSKPTFSTNPSHLKTSFTYRTAFMTTGLERTYIMLIVSFLISHFNLLFVPCGRLSWLPVSFLLHVKYTLSYRIAYSSCWVSMSRSSNMWTKHIDAVVSKAASRLYFLKQLSQADVPTSDKPHFYTTVVRPVLEYATWIGRCIL